MNDSNEIESRLRHHLNERAGSVDVNVSVGQSLIVKEDARRHTASRHRRRMATASALTVAAVTAGLVVISRDPGTQDVATERNNPAAASGLAAGSATGSTTGSSTGSPVGWTGSDSTDDVTLPLLAAHVDPSFVLTDLRGRTTSRGSGESAADIAVAAQVGIGGSTQFIIASVQDSKRLQSGKGGTEVTLAGRPGRVLFHRAAMTLTWDVTDTERVLVEAVGVDDATLEAWLGSLSRDAATGTWRFSQTDPAPGGLSTVDGIETPVGQQTRALDWNKTTVDAAGQCVSAGYSMQVTSGGKYEFWASVGDQVRWNPDLPTAVTVAWPGPASSKPAEYLGFTSMSGDELLVTDGTTVVRATRWSSDANPVTGAKPIADDLFTATDAEWAALVPGPSNPPEECMKDRLNGKFPPPTVDPSSADAPVAADPAGAEPPAVPQMTTTIAPPADNPPPTPAPTMAPPTTFATTTTGA